MTIRKSKPERRRERDGSSRHHRQKNGHSYRSSVEFMRQTDYRGLNSRTNQRLGTSSSGSSSSSLSGSSIPETYPYADSYGWPRTSAQSVEADANVNPDIELWRDAPESPSDKNNSDDEYRNSLSYGTESSEKDFEFARRLRENKGYEIFFMAQDGACLFRAVAHQIFGDASMHGEVRRLCIDYISLNRDYFSQFITEDFDHYIERKRKNDCYGNHVELQAISEMYNRPLEIYRYSVEPQLLTPQLDPQDCDNGYPIRLSYHQEGHYNSVVDPYKATIGVGLGLPGHQPGSADRVQVDVATKESELLEIEEAMLKDKMKETTTEAVQDQIEKQVAAESFIEWMNKKGSDPGDAGSSRSSSSNKPRCKVKPPVTQATPHSPHSLSASATTSNSNKRRNSRNTPPTGSCSPTSYGATASSLMKSASPKASSSPSHPSVPEYGVHFDETASLMNGNIPFELKELDDFVLRQVLMESERDYWLQLTRGQQPDTEEKRNNEHPNNEAGCSKS